MENEPVSRTQLSLTFAWALTPWKAQGMSLEKVHVKIGAAASRPGVAFTTLTRARHPDGLLFDDDFPVMSTFQKQRKHQSFRKRQHFERMARVRFSETIREHMRDVALYGEAHAWTANAARSAQKVLDFVRNNKTCPD